MRAKSFSEIVAKAEAIKEITDFLTSQNLNFDMAKATIKTRRQTKKREKNTCG